MNRRKSPKRNAGDSSAKRESARRSQAVAPAPPDDVSANSQESGSPDSGDPEGMPSSGVRGILSLWIPLHLFAIFISFTAVVEPSSLHGSLQNLLRPYLQVTHFDADDRLVYLAHGDQDERAHRLQVTENEITNIEAGAGEEGWTTLGPRGQVLQADGDHELARSFASRPGLAESDRYARWLSTAATLSENDQPSLVAELLLPVVRSDESIRAIRIARRLNDLDATIDESLPPPYMARVVRTGENIALVQLQPARLSAVAPKSTPGQNAKGESQNNSQTDTEVRGDGDLSREAADE